MSYRLLINAYIDLECISTNLHLQNKMSHVEPILCVNVVALETRAWLLREIVLQYANLLNI